MVPRGPKPASNMVGGVLTTLFCCLPLGIVSILYASQVGPKWSRGDREGAEAAAAKAGKWALAAVATSAVLAVVYLAFMVTTGGAAELSE